MLEMNYTKQQLTVVVVSEGLRPALAGLELGAPARLLSLIERSWDGNTQNRPSFDDTIPELDLITGKDKSFTVEEEDVAEPSSNDEESIKSFQPPQENINWFVQGGNISSNTFHDIGFSVKSWVNYSDNPSTYLPFLS